MARTVFFSFHYDRDVMRVQIVKNHYVTKGNYIAAGYFDGSLEEKAKKEGADAVKRLINAGLQGSSVTCVLIGNETFKRPWVHYEIFKSIELGRGVFGIRIHQLADFRRLTDAMNGKDELGISPFNCLGYGRKSEKLAPMIHYSDGWKDAPHQSLLTNSAATYLKGVDKPMLNSLFRIYDWVDDDGFSNFGKWVEAAAVQAGR